MNNRTQKFLSFAMIFAFVFLFTTEKIYAAPVIDLTQPVEINGYMVNIADIVAENSLLWPLLANFDRLSGNFSECVADTTTLATNNEVEMRALFPWFWDGGSISYGVDTFCYVLSEVPYLMSGQLAEAGVQSPFSSGTTNLWDSSVVPNWHSVNGLVFDHELVRIEFTEEIDLLSYDFVNMVIDFASAFDVNTGYIALNSEMIQGLKSTGAVITLKNVPSFEDPVILVDGRLNEQIISALVYDPDAKTVTFNTEHFTSFEVVERSSVPVIEDEDERNDDCKKIHGNNAYKKAYQRVKYYKGHDYDLYLALQSVYKTYRTVGDTARDTLMQSDITTYDKYKKYRRYHKYKECK